MFNEYITFPKRSVTFPVNHFYLLNNFLKLLIVQLSGSDSYFLVSCSYEILLHYFNKFN